jgi:hypothetical protein
MLLPRPLLIRDTCERRTEGGGCKGAHRQLSCSFLQFYALGRDGGTGRRSGLKIRRASALGGSTPPPGTNLNCLF